MPNPTLRLWLRCLGAAVTLALAATGPAKADSDATTDDKSVTAPTPWQVYQNVSGATVGALLGQNQARLTDIEIYDPAVPTFTVTMVKNQGVYGSGYWWYYGQTPADIGTNLANLNARLIDITPYTTPSGIRFAAIMVPNTGATGRNWGWQVGVSSAQIGTYLSNSAATPNPQRLVRLKSYVEGGVRKYVAISVSNTGADQKGWQYWFGQTAASVSERVASFGGRIVSLDRQSDGTYNFIQVQNTGTSQGAWWYRYGMGTTQNVDDFARQLAARPIDLVAWTDSSGGHHVDGVFLDAAATADTRRMRTGYGKTYNDGSGAPLGIYESFLREVGGTVKVDLNSDRPAEVASSFKVFHLLNEMKRVEAGEFLRSSFDYYRYPSGPADNPLTPNLDENKDACPYPAEEIAANRITTTVANGLKQMLSVSDNRTTRGVVLRAGGLDAINATIEEAGLTHSVLQHNIGCAYRDPATGRFDDVHLRNSTTARDLASVWEGVWTGDLLSETNGARSSFFDIANPVVGSDPLLQAVIKKEASKLGLPRSVASEYGALVKTWIKRGSYGTCLADDSGGCAQRVTIRSGAGIVQLPYHVRGKVRYRTYSYGNLISDLPITCFGCSDETAYNDAFWPLEAELLRSEVKRALKSW